MIWGRLKGLLGAKGEMPALPSAALPSPARPASICRPASCLPADPAESLPRLPRKTFAATDNAADWLRQSGVIARAVQPGEMIPDFELGDQHGATVGLQALLDRGQLVMTFTLGAECAACRASLSSLQDALAAINAAGTALVAVSPDPRERSLALAEANGLAYPLLQDTQKHIAQLFGLLYEPPQPSDIWFEHLGVGDAGKAMLADFAPLPATYVVDTASIARFVFLDPDPARRVDPADVLTALRNR